MPYPSDLVAPSEVIKYTEDDLFEWIRQYVKDSGGVWWMAHTHDSRRSYAGFPDLVMVHVPPESERGAMPRLIFAELKGPKGRLSHAQRGWLWALDHVAKVCPVVEVYVWRPAEWDQIILVLKGEHRG